MSNARWKPPTQALPFPARPLAFTASRRTRRRKQLRDVFHVERFPVLTWLAAGSILTIAFFADMPNREVCVCCATAPTEPTHAHVRPCVSQRQAKERALQANLAEAASTPEREVAQILPGGKLLLRDGSVVEKG